MKKIILFASALAGLFLAASCQQENLEPVAGSNVVSYTISVPGAIGTKAIGDNVEAVNQLVYEVYRTEAASADDHTAAETWLFQKTATITEGVAKVDFELVNNQNFRVLFWAQVENNGVYTIAAQNGLKNVTVSQSLSANAEKYAAFAGSDYIKYGDKLAGRKVELVRPVAQLNIATTEKSLKVEGQTDVVMTTTGVTVKGLSTSYNVATKEAGDVAATASAYAATLVSGLSEGTLTVNGTAYTYVSMNYVGFAEQTGNNVVVSYTINTENVGTITNTINNVPVKANHRTNIIGNLITSKSDYTVSLDAEWGDDDEVVEIWDGETIKAPSFDPTTQTWTINNGAELAWFANAVNGTLSATAQTKADEAPVYDKKHTVTLGHDINLGGCEWTSIGVGKNHFMGTFDGAGYCIEDFRISKRNGGDQAAVFGTVSGSPTIMNLTIAKAKVVYPGSGDFYAAGLVGTAYGHLTINNVTVKDSEISGNNKVAGILAHDGVVSSLSIDNCHVEGCKIESLNAEDGGNVGGLVGLLQAGIEHSIKNSSVKNTVIDAINSTNTGKRANGEFVACAYGKNTLKVVIENCEVSDNTFTQNAGVTYVSPYGVFVGGYRETNEGVPTVIVDGKEMIQAGLVKDGDTYVVSAANALQTAIDRVADGETITIMDDFSVAETSDPNGNVVYYTGDQSFTIDLNGKTIDGNTSNVVFRFQKAAGAENTITIKNGTIIAKENTWSAISVGSSCDTKTIVNLSDLTVKSQKANDMAVRARSGAEFTITRCTIDATNGAGGICAGGGSITLNDVTVNQEGWYANNWNSVALGVSGEGKMTVNSGNYTSDPDGKSNGTWVAYIMSSGGTLEINGGTFNGTVGETADASNACGLICADRAAVVNINGGVFNSNGAVLDMRNNEGTLPNPVATLASGTFSSDPRISGLYNSNLITVAAEHKVVEENGVWKVVIDPTTVTDWDTLTEAINNGKSYVQLTSDITYNKSFDLKKEVNIDLNGKSLEISDPALMLNLHSKVTIENGTIKGKLYARNGADITISGVTFNGTIKKQSCEGALSIQAGCDVLVKDCTFSATQLSGEDKNSTRPLSIEGRSSGSIKFENCSFKSNTNQGQVYVNKLSGTATLEFLNCNFNNKTPNITLAANYPLTNMRFDGTTKLSSVTLEMYEDTKAGITEEETAYLKSMFENNSFTSFRIFTSDYTSGFYLR